MISALELLLTIPLLLSTSDLLLSLLSAETLARRPNSHIECSKSSAESPRSSSECLDLMTSVKFLLLRASGLLLSASALHLGAPDVLLSA